MDLAVNATNEPHLHYLLSVYDIEMEGQIKTVPLTQIGLNFSDRVLRVAQIEEANALLENHLTFRDQCAVTASAQDIDPNILSHAGIGRNATLITYREGLSRIRAGMQVDALNNTLEEIVAQGRRDRGPKFLHSCAQLREVRAALLKALQDRDRDRGQHPFPQVFPQMQQLRTTSRSPRGAQRPEVRDPTEHARSPQVSPSARNVAGFSELSEERIDDQFEMLPQGEIQSDSRQSEVSDGAEKNGLTPAQNNAVNTEPVSAEVSSTPQQRILACLKEPCNDSPLQMFDALSRESTEAAAFCAVQVQRMMTPTAEPGRLRHMRKSMHADMDVTAPSDNSVNRTLAPPELVLNHLDKPQSNDGKYRRPPPQPASAFIAGLLQATQPQQNASSPCAENGSNFFPHGLAAALEQGRVGAPLPPHDIAKKLSLGQPTPFLVGHKNTSMLQVLERHAPANPDAAALVHFLDQALLIKGAPEKIQTKRFQHATNDERAEFAIKSSGTEGTFPTFLVGVKRAFVSNSSQENVWQVMVTGEPTSVKSKPELIAHVIGNALAHMTDTDAVSDATEMYPLIVYELLAKIVDGVQVPERVIAHESALINVARENTEGLKQQKIEKRTTFRANEDAYQQRIKIVGEEILKSNAAEGFHTPLQAMVGAGSCSQELIRHLVDVRIPLIGQTGDIDLTKLVGECLEKSHDRQVIDNRGLDVRVDKRSWLRTAWLSVLSCVMSPEELAGRIKKLEYDVPLARHEKQIEDIKAIASYFAENPRGFMQGVLPEDAGTAGVVSDWPENLQHGARLGSSVPMNYVLRKWLPESAAPGMADKIIEEYLKDLHTNIAAAFRSTDAGIMPFLASLVTGYENGGSTLPVTLHRGLGLPVMVIEQGTHDRFTDEGVPYLVAFKDMRVAAPVGSELAALIKLLEGALSIDPVALHALLQQFNDKPVIWLQHGTYSLYLPKRLTRAGNQSEDVPASMLNLNALEDSVTPALSGRTDLLSD